MKRADVRKRLIWQTIMNEKAIKAALAQARGLVTALEKMLPEHSGRLPAEIKFKEGSLEYMASFLLYKEIMIRDSNFRVPNLLNWCKDIDKLMRIDGRTFNEIVAVIRWCQQDDFWQNNILSTKKLREKFPQLSLKMNGERYGKNSRYKKLAKGEQNVEGLKREINSAFDKKAG